MQNRGIFIRTVALCSVIFFNMLLFFGGICICYQNIRLEGYGEYKSATEITDNSIRFLDFNISI